MSKTVAIIDYGVGNLFSVAQACREVGLDPVVTDDAATADRTDGLILPGVGAFGYAMQRLQSIRMVDLLRGAASEGKPIFGICLGFQLLFDVSEELGETRGLGIVSGRVMPLRDAIRANGFDRKVRSPNVNWLPIVPTPVVHNSGWQGTMLHDVQPGTNMYFVHSFYAAPTLPGLAHTSYCGFSYCCAIQSGSVFGSQFHPEKSGEAGLSVYRAFAASL